MDKPQLLHLLTPEKNASPFDVNMAYDAGYTAVIPYTGVALEEVERLVQDAIFSRAPKNARRTGLFLGGTDPVLAWRMLERARSAMVPPFAVSAFADPNGAFTTAAALVACAEGQLRKGGSAGLEGAMVRVFGGTGPVGMAAAVLAARAGAAVTVVSHESEARAAEVCDAAATAFGVTLSPANGSTSARKAALVKEATVIFSTAKAGVQVLDEALLAEASALQVAVDVNAVPPAGIAGVGVMDNGAPLAAGSGHAVGIGALAVGNVKYQVMNGLFRAMLEAEKPLYLHFDHAFEQARRHVG